MKKVGIVLGAAAVAVLAGCKDPNYRGYSKTSQNEVKQTEEAPSAAPAPEEVKAAAPEPEPVVAEPAAQKPEPAVQKPEPAPVEETTDYIVQRGDYLAKISKKYNVTIAAIRRLNPQIKDDNVVRVGQKIKLPGKIDVGEQKTPTPTPAAAKKAPRAYKPYTGATKEYIVKSGDTLGGIAHAHGLRVRQLKELNGLKKDLIRVGQKLKVPAEKPVAARKAVPAEKKAAVQAPKAPAAAKPAEAPAPAAAPAEAAPVEPAAKAEEESTLPALDAPAAGPAASEPASATNEISYTVQEGEDLTDVAIKFSVSQGVIRDLNNLGDEPLKAGQVLKLPADAVEQQ